MPLYRVPESHKDGCILLQAAAAKGAAQLAGTRRPRKVHLNRVNTWQATLAGGYSAIWPTRATRAALT